MNTKQRIVSISLLASGICFAQALSQNQSSSSNSGKNKPAAQTHQREDGARIFEQNCSRCHNTPEGFPPSISGTVLHHMRVRASLSKTDEEKLLRFLNP